MSPAASNLQSALTSIANSLHHSLAASMQHTALASRRQSHGGRGHNRDSLASVEGDIEHNVVIAGASEGAFPPPFPIVPRPRKKSTGRNSSPRLSTGARQS